MRRGTLTRHLAWQDAEGRRTSVTQRRFVSMKDEHLAGLDDHVHGGELVGDGSRSPPGWTAGS